MLQGYINNSWVPITDRQKYYIEYQYGGQQTLSFSLPVSSDLNKDLLEEVQIKEDSENIFLIKKINRVGSYIDYNCELDMDEFCLNVYKSTKDEEKFQTKSLSQIINAILPPNWTLLNASIRDIKRTIELNGATDYDILFKCEEIFDVVFEINNLNKTVMVIDPELFEYTGLYIHRDLNLKSYTMKGDSSTLITRLYCEGKDGLTFSSINNGKDYIENLSYKNKVLSAYWKDERYTVAENLLTDGQKKLDNLAVPNRSYVFNVIDLANLNKKYKFLTIHLYQLVKVIIDEEISILNRVVKYRKYPDDNEKSMNVVTLSNEPQTLNNVISNALGGDVKDPIKGSFLEQAQKDSLELINDFSTKGHRYETENETYFLDKLPKEAAKFVMRQNLGGIAFSQNGWAGPYITAWTIDGKFNADFITAGTLRAIKIEAAEIFGGSININEKFIVNSDGKLKATDADISGKMNSTLGSIAGFELGEEGFTKTTSIKLKKTYTEADSDRIQKIVTGEINPTQNDYYLYDTDGDGKISAADYLRVKTIYVPAKSSIIYTDVIINSNPYSDIDVNRPLVLVRYRGENGDNIAQTFLSARTIETPYIDCDTVNAKSGDFDDITTRELGFSSNEGYLSCKLYGGHYNDQDNIYVDAVNGYLAFYSWSNAVYYAGNYINENWSAGSFYPGSGGVALGRSSASNRWYRLYANNASSESSDERLKTNIIEFDNRYIKLFELLTPVMYHWKSNVENNKEAGLVAQQVQDAMKKCNISDKEFGCVDYSDNEGYLGLIYRHFQILTMFYVQFKNKEIKTLRDDFNDLVGILKGKGVIECTD